MVKLWCSSRQARNRYFTKHTTVGYMVGDDQSKDFSIWDMANSFLWFCLLFISTSETCLNFRSYQPIATNLNINFSGWPYQCIPSISEIFLRIYFCHLTLHTCADPEHNVSPVSILGHGTFVGLRHSFLANTFRFRNVEQPLGRPCHTCLRGDWFQLEIFTCEKLPPRIPPRNPIVSIRLNLHQTRVGGCTHRAC